MRTFARWLVVGFAGLLWSRVAPGAQAPAVTVVPAVVSGAAEAAREGWKVLAEARGDLNRDGRPDLAVALTRADALPNEWDDDRPRVLAFHLRRADGRLHLSASSTTALLPHNAGGVWGDPFESLAVERDAVVVRHYGGSSHRWGSTHRFRLQEGRWRLIGETEVAHRAAGTFRQETDRNLVTGLVLFQRHPELEEEGGPVRQAYHELRAAPAPKAPLLDGVLSPGEWPGLTLRLAGKEDIVAARSAWRGASDLSAVLVALTRGGSLYLRADVSDDRVLAGDRVRLVSREGKAIPPAEERRSAVRGGYRVEMRFPLAALRPTIESEYGPTLFRVSVEVVDVDGTGERTPTLLSTSRGGRRYPAAVRLVEEPGLPLFPRFRIAP